VTAPQSQVEQKEADVVVTRKCKGCDGTGEGFGFPFRVSFCLACQGSGQVTDRIPVAARYVGQLLGEHAEFERAEIVRSHEGWEAAQRELSQRTGR